MRSLLVKTVVLGLALICVSAGADVVDDIVSGLDAYKRGDYETAFREFKVLAEAGDPRAQTNLGAMYAEGKGVARDDRQALLWSLKAADQNHPPAQFNVSGMYREGRGVPRDLVESFKWTRRAAANGHISAQYNLGLMYEAGMGTATNREEAANWFEKAAGNGHQRAARRLAALRAAGIVPRAEPMAVQMTAAPAPAGGFRVQIGAYRDPKVADLALASAKRDFASLKGGMRWELASSPGGEWRRLRLGPVADRSGALALCRELKRRRASLACFAVPPARKRDE